MANTILGNLVWKITGDTTDFDKKINTSESRLSAFSSKAGQIGNKLTLGLTAPLTALGGVAVKAASDLGESLNAINVVFGDASDTINNFGEITASAVGLSQQSFNELATVTGTLLKTTGQDIDTVAESTIELTKRAADVASVFNEDVNVTLEAFNAAIRGEAEPARRFGVLLSENAVQAEILASGLDKVSGLTEEQRKVQARYNIILKQTEQTAGDFANTSDSLANQSKILKAELTDVAAELGEVLLPFVVDVVSFARELVQGFSDLSDESKTTAVAVAGVAAAIGPIAKILSIATGPAGWITLAVAGLAALTAVVIANRQEEKELAKEIEAVEEAVEGLRGELPDLATDHTNAGIAAFEQALNQKTLALQTAETTLEVLKQRQALADLRYQELLQPLIKNFELVNGAIEGVALENEDFVNYIRDNGSGELFNYAQQTQFLNEKVEDAEKAVSEARGEIELATQQLQQYKPAAEGAAEVTGASGSQDTLTGNFEDLAVAVSGLRQSFTDFADEAPSLIAPFSSISAGIKEIIKVFVEDGPEIQKTFEAISAGIKEIKQAFVEDGPSLAAPFSEASAGAKELILDIEELNEVTISLEDNIRKSADRFAGLRDELRSTGASIKDATKGTDDLTFSFEDVGRAAVSSAANSLDTLNASLLRSEGAFANYGDAVVSSIAQIIDAIGNQIIGQGIALLFTPGGQGPGASAIAAGGALKLIAAGLGATVAEAPRVGDTIPEAPETALDDPQAQADDTESKSVINNTITIDGEVLYKAVTNGIQNGQVRLTE